MSTTATEQNQSTALETPAALLGHVHGIDGSRVTTGVLTAALNGAHRDLITVGKFIKIQTRRTALVGVITDISIQTPSDISKQGYSAVGHVDLMGEITQLRTGSLDFRRGVIDYPTIGDSVSPLTNKELRAIFVCSGSGAITIGSLQQDNTVGACVDVDEMLNKHFAVLGTTGVGKSSGVALILRQILQARPDLRIFILDAHNEYGHCFGASAHIVNPRNLKLPFWLFNFEEIVDIFFAGRSAAEEEIEILAEIIPLAKTNYAKNRRLGDAPTIKKLDSKSIGYMVDTPVPYRLADLVSLLDELMGKLENRSSRMTYHKLITRIETVSNDPQYAFMFENANVGGDTMVEAISQLFRLPADGKPMTIMQLAGFPVEVTDAIVSVLGRLAFDFGLWSDGAFNLLFVCEEAHRYVSVDRNVGFGPTRRAISRIAKEGRKYGIYLGLVTQRPAELDPTILSQCSTLFAMRMSNDRDQKLLQSAVADSTANIFAIVPSLGTREVLAFGIGVPLPMRLTFSELPQECVPRSQAFTDKSKFQSNTLDSNFIAAVVERWRNVAVRQKNNTDDDVHEATPVLTVSAPPLQPAPKPDPNPLALLRRPLGSPPDPHAALRSAAPRPLPR